MPMRAIITMPIQKALKLPAVRPERMLSEAPPSFDEVTTSATCALSVDVKTLMSSGMIAPASVPQVMIDDSFHHCVSSPPSIGTRTYDAPNVKTIDTSDVTHTSCVRGASKFILSALPYRAFT